MSDLNKTTPIPNTLFDVYLSTLKPSETVILLTVFRQTIGWIDQRTGMRKTRDWITNSQFQRKTGLSDKTVTQAINTLCEYQLLKVTDEYGNVLYSPESRRGKLKLFYAPMFKSQRNEHQLRL